MSKQIWKFELPKVHNSQIDMPHGSEILCVQVQGNSNTCIWALVDSAAPKTTRHFEIYGTGHEISNDMSTRKYIGTFQLSGGSLVFHLFEVIN